MIQDPHARARAVLWCLQDVDPQMPLALALGYLKAVEALLAAEDAAREVEDGSSAEGAAASIARSAMSDPLAVDIARSGEYGLLKKHLQQTTAGSASECAAAAATMVALHSEAPAPPEDLPF